VFEVLRRDPHAAISDHDPGLILDDVEGEMDGLVDLRILLGVREEVLDGAAEERAIPTRRDAGVGVDDEGACGEEPAEAPGGVLDELGEIERLGCDRRDAAARGLRQVEP
jgi:hypothetical protein